MIHSAAVGDMTWVATVFVFLSVAASVAGICFRVMYANQRSGVKPEPAPLPASPATMFCPFCGRQNIQGTPKCGCGFNLASIPLSPAFSPAPAITPDFQPRDYKTPLPPPLPAYQVPSQPTVPKSQNSRGWNGWAIYDEGSARAAARQGMWAAFLIAGATGVVAYLAGNGIPLVPGITSAAWIDAAIFAALGIGLMRMSRAAAVGALVLYVVERIWAMEHMAGGFSAVALPMIACFIQSVRATFAYHNYRRQSPYAPYGSSLPTT